MSESIFSTVESTIPLSRCRTERSRFSERTTSTILDRNVPSLRNARLTLLVASDPAVPNQLCEWLDHNCTEFSVSVSVDQDSDPV